MVPFTHLFRGVAPLVVAVGLTLPAAASVHHLHHHVAAKAGASVKTHHALVTTKTHKTIKTHHKHLTAHHKVVK